MKSPNEASAGLLSVEGLSLRRGGQLIHHDFSLALATGITVILGPNGVGKTTLIEGLLDRRSLATGAIALDNQRVTDPESIRHFYAQVGYMPQRWRFVSQFTALESVAFAAWLKGVPSRRITEKALAALDWVLLSQQAKTKVRKLSGGMRQRVGLAEAFVNDPRLVLLDEPTVGLDPAQRAAFRTFLREKSQGSAILLSTHLTDDVEALADRVIVMTTSGIGFDGTPAELGAIAADVRGASSALEAGYLAIAGTADGSEVRFSR